MAALGQLRDQGMALPGAVADVALPSSQGDKRLVLWQTRSPPSPSLHLSHPPHQQLNCWRLGGVLLTTLLFVWVFFFRGRDIMWSPVRPTGPFPCLQRVSHHCQSSWVQPRGLVGTVQHCTPLPLNAECCLWGNETPILPVLTIRDLVWSAAGSGHSGWWLTSQVAGASPFPPQSQLPRLQPGNRSRSWHTMSSAEERLELI